MMVNSFVGDLQTLPLPSKLIVNISFQGSVENVVASIILTFMDTDFHDKVPFSVLHTRVGRISTLFHFTVHSFTTIFIFFHSLRGTTKSRLWMHGLLAIFEEVSWNV